MSVVVDILEAKDVHSKSYTWKVKIVTLTESMFFPVHVLLIQSIFYHMPREC